MTRRSRSPTELRAHLQKAGEAASRHLLDDILDLIEDDIQFIRDKNADKEAQLKIVERAMKRARNRYESELASGPEGSEPSKEAVKALNTATAVYNKFCYIERDEAMKLTNYAKVILDVERFRREDNQFMGIANLTDEELIEQTKKVIQLHDNKS